MIRCLGWPSLLMKWLVNARMVLMVVSSMLVFPTLATIRSPWAGDGTVSPCTVCAVQAQAEYVVEARGVCVAEAFVV